MYLKMCYVVPGVSCLKEAYFWLILLLVVTFYGDSSNVYNFCADTSFVSSSPLSQYSLLSLFYMPSIFASDIFYAAVNGRLTLRA